MAVVYGRNGDAYIAGSVVWETAEKTDFMPRLLPGFMRKVEVYDMTPWEKHRTWAIRDVR